MQMSITPSRPHRLSGTLALSAHTGERPTISLQPLHRLPCSYVTVVGHRSLDAVDCILYFILVGFLLHPLH